MPVLRSLKWRAGVAEEALRLKKERLDDAEQEYGEEEHSRSSSKRSGEEETVIRGTRVMGGKYGGPTSE